MFSHILWGIALYLLEWFDGCALYCPAENCTIVIFTGCTQSSGTEQLVGFKEHGLSCEQQLISQELLCSCQFTKVLIKCHCNNTITLTKQKTAHQINALKDLYPIYNATKRAQGYAIFNTAMKLNILYTYSLVNGIPAKDQYQYTCYFEHNYKTNAPHNNNHCNATASLNSFFI